MIRTLAEGEAKTFLATTGAAFGESWGQDESLEGWERLANPERMHCAVDDDVMVASAGAWEFTLTVPGAQVPAAGVTVVGVLPSHRRKGIATRLMRTQLDDIRAREEPVAILWASESNIYGRFGYGLATYAMTIDIERDRARFREPTEPAGRIRLVDESEALKVLPAVYDRVMSQTPGFFARSEDWWRWRTLYDPEARRRGGGPMFRAVWEHDGVAQGYALYRVFPKWSEEGLASGRVQVMEAIATTPEATTEVWRLLFGIDLVERVQSWALPPDLPLLHLLAEPRRLRATLHDGLWVRVVDVKSALEARSYAVDDAIVVELDDGFCDWNRGTWQIEPSRVTRTDKAPDLALSDEELGAVYLGGNTFSQLAAAGRVRELTENGIARADRMFATPRAPWCPELF